jgi:DNA invertase Pin-like site-specific DNA recombinase
MQIVLAFAEYELESIRERIKVGISRARAQGTRSPLAPVSDNARKRGTGNRAVNQRRYA